MDTQTCTTCHDMKRLAIREESELSTPYLLELQRQIAPGKPAVYISCPDCNSGERRRQDYLDRIADVPDRYKNWSLNSVGQEFKHITDAIWIAIKGSEWQWILLQGGYGTGKSTILAAAVNTAKSNNRSATYTTMSRILDHLKSTYGQTNGETDRFWDHLLSVEVLAIDEVDRYQATDWARDRFNNLINRRFENDAVTIFATNAPIDSFPGYFRDRLNMAQLHTLGGKSRRKVDEVAKHKAKQQPVPVKSSWEDKPTTDSTMEF